MRIQTLDKYNGSGVAYLLREMQKWDTRQLGNVSIKKGTAKSSALLGYGNMRANLNALTGEVRGLIRINILLKDEVASLLPRHGRMTRKYGNSLYYEAKCNNVDELIVAIGMHEFRHYLGYTGQIDSGDGSMTARLRSGKDERAAMAFGWVHLAWFQLEQQERMAA